jgi:putative flippase GtrA
MGKLIRTFLAPGKMLGEFGRFSVVGLTANAAAYILYLLVTAVGTPPLVAITLLYIAGVIQTFFVNRNWSFRHDRALRPAFMRYVITYLSSYFLNCLVQIVFNDVFGVDHRLVQGTFILIAGITLFFVQKFWIFDSGRATER